MQSNIENITLTTQDKTRINALYYSVPNASKTIIVAGATGVPQSFYKSYSIAANDRGINTLTLDYRGIGKSAPESLKGYQMDYLDWARQDLATAIDWAHDAGLPVYLVGHSYGGHAVGLLPNFEKIEGAYVFGAGAGWSGWMPFLERIKVTTMWNVIAPLIVKRCGYLAWSKLGMGEDLPKNVYQQWRRWCQYPNYFFDDENMAWVHDQFAKFNKRLIAVNATDDKWAQPASRDAFFKGYKNAELKTIDLSPQSVGMKKIDHMGYFRKNASQIWETTFDWVKSS